MTSYVSDLLINPVLRQARRFSRTGSSEHVDPLTNRRTASSLSPLRDQTSIVQQAEAVASEVAVEDDELNYLSGRPIVSSPANDDGLNAEGLAQPAPEHTGRSVSAAGDTERTTIVPLRLASLRSGRASGDDYLSDNPSYGIPDRFQTGSPMSLSDGSTVQNGTQSRGSFAETRSENASADTISRAAGTGYKIDSSLPEDDGMAGLRKRILKIQEMELDPGGKARLVHQLLNEDYRSSQSQLSLKVPARTHSPTSMTSQEYPDTPSSVGSFSFWHSNDPAAGVVSSLSGPNLVFQLSEADLAPTYTPIQAKPSPPPPEENRMGQVVEVDQEPEESEHIPSLGCKHYKRNVKLQCFTCNRWYTCRFCHDEAEDHTLIRRETKNMLCMLCGRAQRAGEVCIDCGARAAWYYCGVCKLWDDDTSKSIYHCDDCGICRKGSGIGKDYVHCKTCGVCLPISKEHKCIERANDCDCPICGDYLFNSPQTVGSMTCGHTIHQKCYQQLMKTTYKCPLCSQSVVNMETQFRSLDRAIESQPMPEQFQDTKAVVSCNDCYAKSIVKYHWLGLKCGVCDSYNTAQLQIMSEPAALETVPAPEDIIPGPRADIFIENIQALASRNTQREQEVLPSSRTARPTRQRRHSSHVRLEPDPSSRFSPYPLPQRIGRSVSPMPLRSHEDTPVPAFLSSQYETAVVEDDEPDLDFWGRDQSFDDDDDDMADDDDDDELSSEDEGYEEDDDDDDQEGRMTLDLIGHR